MNQLYRWIILALKGVGMGAANVIPGVSGGTIALITGVFEKLIHSIKSFDLKAIKLLLSGKFKEFAQHVNLSFLLVLFAGVFISIFSLAILLEWLFAEYPIYVWSFFFGLILASVYFVGRTIEKWKVSVIVLFLFGTLIAVSLTWLRPATENTSFIYLIICGVVAVCSMIIPGLSGSFVLLLMGNYELVMRSVAGFDIGILFPVVLGAVFGLIAFSHLLSWVFKKFRDQTLSTLTGFMFGSLLILWPWKEKIFSLASDGSLLLDSKGEAIPESYQFFLPEVNTELVIAIACILLGVLSISLIEIIAGKKK